MGIEDSSIQLTFFGEIGVNTLEVDCWDIPDLPVGEGEVVLLVEGPVPHETPRRVLQY